MFDICYTIKLFTAKPYDICNYLRVESKTKTTNN